MVRMQRSGRLLEGGDGTEFSEGAGNATRPRSLGRRLVDDLRKRREWASIAREVSGKAR